MAAPINPPVGQITSLGIGKETTPGVAVVPTVFHAHMGWKAGDSNVMVRRTGARKRLGQTYPATGVYMTKGSLEVECDPDTLPQLMAFALGGQATPVAAGASVVAKSQTLTMNTPLPSFTLQINRVTDAISYFGCKVSSMALGMSEKGGMTAKFTLDYLGSVVVTAAPPTFSTKLPFEFHNPASFFKYKGATIGNGGSNAVLTWECSLSNNLIDSYYSFGNGRFKLALPEQQRVVTGKAELGFELNAPILDFFGGTSGPGNVIAGVSIEMFVASTDYADPGALLVPYSVDLLMANSYLESATPDVKPNGILTMPLIWESAESANGASDDIRITCTNTNSTIF